MPDQAGGIEICILGNPENWQGRRQRRHQARQEGSGHGACLGLDASAFHGMQGA